MKNNHVIILCFLACLGFFVTFLFDIAKKENSADKFKKTFIPTTQLDTDSPDSRYQFVKWVFEKRLDNYYNNIITMNRSLLNIVIFTMIGILLIFYRPNGINIPFISFKIPEGLIYFIVVFGGLYSWSNFGLEFNSAIGSRVYLHETLTILTPDKLFTNKNYNQLPQHILTDNALLDGWCGLFYAYFDEPNLEFSEKLVKNTFTILALLGLYGSLFGLLFGLCLIVPLEFGVQNQDSWVFSGLLILFTLILLLVTNIFWVFLHPYSALGFSYVWLITCAFIFFWEKKGRAISKKLSKANNLQ